MPYRYSKAALIGLALAPLIARGDVLLRFDASKGSCALKQAADGPQLECDASAGPAILLGSTPVSSERQGARVVYRFPDAGERPLIIKPEGDTWRISWPQPAANPQSAAAAAPTPLAAPVPASSVPPATTVPAPPASAAASNRGPQIDVAGAPPAAAGAIISPSDLATAVQTLVKTYESMKPNEAVFDYSIPESPGFVVLGLTPENVAHPRTLRDFVVSVKNGIDQSGELKAGLALDFNPLQLLERDESLADYLDIKSILSETEANRMPRKGLLNSPNHILRNTTFSLATTQGTGDSDKSVNLGVGLHIPLIDKSDGREHAAECFAESFFAAKIAPGGTVPMLVNQDAVNKATSKCFSDKTHWNDTVWTASLGYALTAESGNFSDTVPATRGLWTSFGYGFDGGPPILRKNAQLILHAKLLYKERVTDPAVSTSFIDQDSRVLGFAFKMGSPTFNTSLQASFARLKDRTHDTHDSTQRLSVGVEYRVADNLWLVGSVGGEGGRTNGENKSFVLGGLKYGSAATPQFAPTRH
jgi:hypothetical protein